MSIVLLASGRTRTRGAFSILDRLLRTLAAHENRVHLHALSDHTLRDMGFLRDQIDDVLRGTVRRSLDTLR